MTSFSSPSLLSVHGDVLKADIPNTPEAKARLVEELKNRGRAAVQAKAFPDAHALYHKALEVEESAILYSNLSLVQCYMGHYEEGRQSAESAVRLDPSYVKGYWRLGQALTKLHRPSEALESMYKALELDPTNKALKKEVEKLQLVIKEQEDLVAAKPTSTTTEAATTGAKKTATTANKTTTATKAPAVTATDVTATDKKKTVVKDEDDENFTKSDHVRGYKVVNGKKTSYFHKELSPEEKEMIGDIRPKRLETPQLVSREDKSTSAWNKAGTWEERDVTAWAKDTLGTALLSTNYTLADSSPLPGTVVQVTKVSKLDGHASYATVRGKKRYIYEFLVKIDWSLSEGKASGSMTFPDVDGTCELGEGYEMAEFSVRHDTESSLKPVLDRFVQHGGFREALHQCFDDWVRLFRTTY